MSRSRREAAGADSASSSIPRTVPDAVDFLNEVAVALHQVGPDGVVLWANQAELDLLGYSAEEYVGRHISDFHADADALEAILEQLAKGVTLRSHPARLRARDGSIRHVLLTSSAQVESGELVCTRCVTIDVTAQKQARETSALMAAIVDSSDDAIVSKSLDGIISSWNKGAERLFGWLAAEVVGQPITLIIPPELRDEERSILGRLRRGEQIDH